MGLTRRVFIQRMTQIGGYSAAFSTMRARGLIASPGPSPLPQLAAGFGKGEKGVILCAGIAGLVSAYAAYAQLDKPQGQTYFVGDYLSHLVGWQEGAAPSAHHAIDRIAQQIRS